MARLTRAALMRGVEFLQKPGVTVQKLSTLLKRRGKIEARSAH